jgi:proteic killer suppression protein
MIKNFKCKETLKIWEGNKSKKLPPDIQNRALRKLAQLDAATTLDDLKIPPNNHLEKLHGNRKGQMSIRINNQWRICFEWQNGEALEVEIVDYHK